MRKELGFIHGAVLLFGLSGLFAKFIDLSAVHIVLGRVMFAAFFLFIVQVVFKKKLKLQRKKDYLSFLTIGAVLAIHWGSFFYSIQLSTVAIGLVTFATFPFFASFIEPIVFKEAFQKRSVILALLTFIGVSIIVPEFSFSNEMTVGAIWGLVSSITFAILSMLNRALTRAYSSLTIGFYQNLFASLWLIPVLFYYPIQVHVKNGILLVLLGVVFTGIAHVLYIQGLRKVNVRTASIIASLEPVYGIIAAIVLLSEIPLLSQWIGILFILIPVIYASIIPQQVT